MGADSTALVKGLLQNGITPKKLNRLIESKGKEPSGPYLRKCLCTQIVSQGDCKLKEVVKQVRLNGFI